MGTAVIPKTAPLSKCRHILNIIHFVSQYQFRLVSTHFKYYSFRLTISIPSRAGRKSDESDDSHGSVLYIAFYLFLNSPLGGLIYHTIRTE